MKCSSAGAMVIALFLAGHTSAQEPQPVQSIRDQPSVNFLSFAPFIGTASATPAASSSVITNGRTTACGQTLAHQLHCIQFLTFQCGRSAAIPRFSYAAVPAGIIPVTVSINLETGTLSAVRFAVGTRISFKNSVCSLSLPASGAAGASSSAFFQLSGTSTLWIWFRPASTALQFMSTMS